MYAIDLLKKEKKLQNLCTKISYNLIKIYLTLRQHQILVTCMHKSFLMYQILVQGLIKYARCRFTKEKKLYE